MMHSPGISSYPKSFNETHCAIDGEEFIGTGMTKEKCKTCGLSFHYPKCWAEHKKETGHKNT